MLTPDERLPVFCLCVCVPLQGYKKMSQKFDGVRRVRGDNYCALRATLFQVLSQSTAVPVWLQEDNVIMVNVYTQYHTQAPSFIYTAVFIGDRRYVASLFYPVDKESSQNIVFKVA